MSEAPYRIQFDNASDPLTARNALGIDSVLTSYATTAYVTATLTSYATTAYVTATFATIANFPAGAWTAWSPTITSSSGTLTTVTLNRARYIQLGKTIIANVDFTLTNAGSGAGTIRITLPVNASASGGGTIHGRETVATGITVSGDISSSASVGVLAKYDGSTPIATGNRYNVNMVYECA